MRHPSGRFAPSFLILPLLLLGLGLLSAGAAFADDVHPNTQSGVDLDKAFHVGEIDNVNLFNGALTLTLPLGPSYPVGGTLSYGLTLVYNSNPWFFQDHAFDGNTTYPLSTPNPCSNAGLGWHLSLGRLNPPCTAAAETGVGGQPPLPLVYEGPDGAQHLFYTTLHASDPVVAQVFYTRDGTYLRLRQLATGESEVDFPDGKCATSPSCIS